MFDGHFRSSVDRAVKPLGDTLRRTKITPDHLTIAGMLIACGAAVAIGAGYLALGLLLVILAALPDLLDGALAKASNTSSQRGAFFDSVVDRVTDALLFGGVAWYFASHESPHLAILPLAVSGMSSVISYERAKAESLGLSAKGGLMERAERIICLCLGLLWQQAAVAPVTAAKIELRRSRRQSRRSAFQTRRARSTSSRRS